MSSLTDRWASSLESLRKLNRFRSFARPAGIDFTSNDYLGYGSGRLATPDNEVPLARSGLASRLLRGHHEIWEAVETELAEWHQSEAVLMMTSGYSANEGLLSTLCEPGDWVATDELNHACIIDGLRLARCRKFAFRHNDLNHLEEGLRAEAERGDPGRVRFVITEALFSMDGDRAPLREVADLTTKYGAYLVVDEAHSTGCYGDTGSGCVDLAGVRDQVLASVHTGGKALGVPGAYIAGRRILKDYLTNKCRHLIFTTALPAECGRWWRDMLPKVRSDRVGREALHNGAKLLREELSTAGIQTTGTEYVVPVMVGDDGPAVRAAERVRGEGFDVRAIRPPSVAPGTARVRVSVHADHTPDQLRALATAFRGAMP